MTEKSSLTASAVASKLDANVNFIQGPCRAAGINAFKAQCIPPAQLVVLIIQIMQLNYFSAESFPEAYAS